MQSGAHVVRRGFQERGYLIWHSFCQVLRRMVRIVSCSLNSAHGGSLGFSFVVMQFPAPEHAMFSAPQQAVNQQELMDGPAYRRDDLRRQCFIVVQQSYMRRKSVSSKVPQTGRGQVRSDLAMQVVQAFEAGRAAQYQRTIRASAGKTRYAIKNHIKYCCAYVVNCRNC